MRGATSRVGKPPALPMRVWVVIAILTPMSNPPPAQDTQMADLSFEAFFRREFHAMVALAYSVSGSRATAEDVAQEAMSRAYRSWDKISRYDKPGAWLRRVTINLAVSNRRRIGAETRARLRLGSPPSLSELPEIHDDVWEAVRQLPAQQRAAVALFYLEDRSVAETAEILQCSVSTAKVHLHRGRDTLGRTLQGGAG